MQTPRSKHVAASNRRLVEAGGRRVTARLRPDAAAVLATLCSRLGLSASAVIERLLLRAEPEATFGRTVDDTAPLAANVPREPSTHADTGS